MKRGFWSGMMCLLGLAFLFGADVAAQQMSTDWISGEWTGLREEQFRVSTTLRLVYDPATRGITGEGDLVNLDRPGVGAKAIVEGSTTRDEVAKKDKVTLKMRHIGGLADGQTFIFELERREDGSLYGVDDRRKASLSLTKK
jgi:hypothetical protein